MKYARVLQYVMNTPWAVEETKLVEILSVLFFRGAGGEFTAEEIKARIGGGNDTNGGGPKLQGTGVAVLPIRGVIAHRMGGMDDMSGGTSCERIAAMLRSVMADASIGTIVLDIDSPGGTVPGVQELAAEIFQARGRGTKRFIAQVNSLAASAAYWLASQCDEIVSMPSGTTGSIGVFSAHDNMAKALEIAGHELTLISAGKYKIEGNPFEPLSDEAHAIIKNRVNAAYTQFVADVARGRGVTPADVRNGYGEGRALEAPQALTAGLIDRIATMDGTLARLAPASTSALRAGPLPDMVDPNADGECPDGYELGDDQMCHRMPSMPGATDRVRRSRLL